MGILSDLKVREVRIEECGEVMVELKSTDFLLEPMYFKWGYSENPVMRLRAGVTERLLKAKKNLIAISGCEGWNFKIWDGFRTLKTQAILYHNYWEELKMKNPFSWKKTIAGDSS